MKNKITRAMSLVLMTLMMITVATSCGPSKPTEEDAQKYVQAVLDLLCHGDYDHSVVLYDVEEGKEGELREDVLDAALEDPAFQGFDDKTNAMLKEYLSEAFAKAKYTIGDAVATDDEGGYDVTVTIEPLRLYGDMNDAELEAKLQEELMKDVDSFLAMSLSEQSNYAMQLTIGYLKESLANPTYADPVDVTVHYGLLDEEKNAYGCTEEEGEKLGLKLFSE